MTHTIIGIGLAAALVGVSGFGSEAVVRAVLALVAGVAMFAAVSAWVQSAMSRMYASSREIALAKAASDLERALQKAVMASAEGMDATTWAADAQQALRKARGKQS